MLDAEAYKMLTIKISKKWEGKFHKEPEIIKGIAKYLSKNNDNDIFYKKLKIFLFDFYPTITMTAFIGTTEFNFDEEHPKYKKKIQEMSE